MAEAEENQEPEAESSQPRPSRWAGFTASLRGTARSVGGFLPKLGLFLFMLALPLMLVAYPAYLLSARLLDYSRASTIDARLTSIEIRTVELGEDQTSLIEARKHYDVVFEFKGDKGQRYASVAEMSWPAPGLKRKLEDEYAVGDAYTLYLLPDHSVEMDEIVASDLFYRMTGLMGLAFLASALFFMLWKRLARRMPSVMPRFPSATQKSIMVGQLVTLVISGLLSVVVSISPLAIDCWLFAAVYWGLAAFISLSLRLLVFADAAPQPEPEEPKKAARPR